MRLSEEGKAERLADVFSPMKSLANEFSHTELGNGGARLDKNKKEYLEPSHSIFDERSPSKVPDSDTHISSSSSSFSSSKTPEYKTTDSSNPFMQFSPQYEAARRSIRASAINTLLYKGTRDPHHPETLPALGDQSAMVKLLSAKPQVRGMSAKDTTVTPIIPLISMSILKEKISYWKEKYSKKSEF
jgi:hypothetical protein